MAEPPEVQVNVAILPAPKVTVGAQSVTTSVGLTRLPSVAFNIGAQGPTGAAGPQGTAGFNAHTLTTAAFTVPVLSGSATVSVLDTSWIVPGQFVYLDTAGGAPGKAGSLQVTAKTPTTVTLKNSSGSITHNFYNLTPTNIAPGSYTTGLEFTVTTLGSLYSISFYKDVTETSNSHSVGLWDANGNLLASAVSSNEPVGPAWVAVPLNVPYPLAKATTYIVGAAYNQAGGYTAGNYPTVVGPISGTMGRYIAASGLTFPANSYNAIYGTDLTFITQTSGSALPGAIVASGSLLTPSGDQGPIGAAGPASTIPGPPGPPGEWVQITQANYNALNPPDPNTLYIVIG